MSGGRPTKLTPELTAAFVQVLSRSCTPLNTMAEAAGIDSGTFHAWMHRGARARGGLFKEFHDAITSARAKGTKATLDMITAIGATDRDWRALSWILERTQPKEFGPRVRVHVEEELTQVYERILAEFRPEPAILERVLRCLAQEGGENPQALEAENDTRH